MVWGKLETKDKSNRSENDPQHQSICIGVKFELHTHYSENFAK